MALSRCQAKIAEEEVSLVQKLSKHKHVTKLAYPDWFVNSLIINEFENDIKSIFDKHCNVRYMKCASMTT